jgi:2-C-methyl-D-erythritol 4-phosphate cytidylyltransferase
VVAVVLAGGSGTRIGADGNKAFIPLAGRCVVSWSLNVFGELPTVGRRILVIRPQDRGVATKIIDRELKDPSVELIEGGASRHGSEWAALHYLREDIDGGIVRLVAIHDAARPLVTRSLAQAVIDTAAESGGSMPGIVADELGSIDDDGYLQPAFAPGSGRLVRTQTPQAFRAKELISAYELAQADGFEGTDTVTTVRRYSNVKIRLVEGDVWNLKIAYPQDLITAERILSAMRYTLL